MLGHGLSLNLSTLCSTLATSWETGVPTFFC